MMKRGRTALWACVLVLAAGMLTGGGCGGDRNGPADREAHKLLVIGIDSADWRILDPLLEQGRMPHLKEFMTQASSGRMKTFIPLQKSPVLWASICTGVEPEVHGIHNFVKGEDERPVTGSAWHAPALWDILTAADRSTAVMGMWSTYPARPIEGVMVSDFLPYGSKREHPLANLVYPDSLTASMVDLRVDPASLTDKDLARFIPADLLERAEEQYPREMGELRDVFAADLSYLAVADYLAHHGDFDLFFFYLRGPDMVSHHFYAYMKADLDYVHLDPDKVAVFKDVVKNYYVWVDEVMGRVLGWFPPDRQTVIVSDHGFYGPRRSGKKGTSEHSEWGIFLARSPLYEAGARFGHLTVLDICPTLLAMMGLPPAHDMPGAILTEPATKEGAKRLGKLDKHRVDSYMSLAPATGPAGERDPKVDEEIRKQLRSLGYIN